MKRDLTTADLEQFSGTEKYYRSNFYPFVYTEGVQYMAEHGGAYWLLDAIASWQVEEKIKGDKELGSIQFWKLTVNADSNAVLVCERDLDDVVVEQKIPHTDFPLKNIKLYLTKMAFGREHAVMLLPSEY
jgi:hypothetical protein